MTSLRTLIRDAQAPHLLRRGILLDLVECKAFAFQQFAPTQRMLDIFHSGDRSQVTYDYHFPTETVVINPPGGPAESRVIERESLAQCFEDGMALAESLDAEDWPHVTMTEIWGSHAPNGSACRLLLSTLHREAEHEQRQNLTAYGHAEEHPHAGGEASHILSLIHI